ncbi:MAG: recombinase family protein, partial [Bacilli bacterium]|nr:recombinase family protein [Bacilli bacterium]
MNHNQTFKAGIYIRLSREDEEKTLESESITSQRDLLISYVKQHHFQLIDEYIDDGYTGTNFERPAFKQMIYDIEQKRINMIITKDL